MGGSWWAFELGTSVFDVALEEEWFLIFFQQLAQLCHCRQLCSVSSKTISVSKGKKQRPERQCHERVEEVSTFRFEREGEREVGRQE